MRCHTCGSRLQPGVTDLPFKRSEQSIIVIKDLPVLQCQNCREYQLEDPTMAAVERMLEKADQAAELEVVKYAA